MIDGQNQQNDPLPLPAPTIELTISMGPTGITAKGPIHDVILCLGMLEAGKQTIIDHNKKSREQSRIEIPKFMPPLRS